MYTTIWVGTYFVLIFVQPPQTNLSKLTATALKNVAISVSGRVIFFLPTNLMQIQVIFNCCNRMAPQKKPVRYMAAIQEPTAKQKLDRSDL